MLHRRKENVSEWRFESEQTPAVAAIANKPPYQFKNGKGVEGIMGNTTITISTREKALLAQMIGNDVGLQVGLA